MSSIYQAVRDYLQDQYPDLNEEQLHNFTCKIDQYVTDNIPELVQEETE